MMTSCSEKEMGEQIDVEEMKEEDDDEEEVDCVSGRPTV